MNYFKHDKALVEEGSQIGEGTRVWAFAHIQSGAKLGSHCNICNGTFVEKGAVIGNHVTIKHNVCIFDGVTIDDDVFVGSNIAFINDRYPRSHRKDSWILEKTHIKKGATLGSNTSILCGLTIAEYAIVGAGSVVTENVQAYAIVVGNPAQWIGWACRCGQPLMRPLKRRSVWPRKLQCPCGCKYFLNAKGLKPL